MNIDEKCEYIDKYVNVEVATKWITVTLDVPLVTNTTVEEPQVVIYSEDIRYFLKSKNITWDRLEHGSSVVNTHPEGTSGIWVFRHSKKIPGAKKKRTGVSMKNETLPKKKTNKEV
jgi:hypothetical protein